MSSRPEIKSEDAERVQNPSSNHPQTRDEDMEDIESPSKMNKIKPIHHKKRSRDESASKTNGDKDMKDKDDQGSDNEDEDDDEDDYDDEDEESSHGSFIAPDDEVEKEILEAYEKDEQEKKKKRKKRRRSFKLEEDDYALIEDNTGVQVKKRKRLQKHSEKERETVDQEEEKAPTNIIKREESDRQNDKDDESEVVRQERRPQHPIKDSFAYDRKRIPQVDARVLDQLDSERVQVAKNIFEDTQTLQHDIHQKQLQRQGFEEEKKGDLEELFDGDEIDDQLLTKQDILIADRDIPERLQVKLGERLDATDEELQEEAEWIAERLVLDLKKKDFAYNSAIVKNKISRVLKMFRNEYLDIPMITKYRKFEYTKEFEEQDVWHIFNYDLEYGKYKQQKQQIHNFIKKVMQFNQNLRVYEEELHFVKNQNELNDFRALVSFLKSYYYEELQTLPEEQRKKNPGRQDQVQFARKYRLDEFARKCMLRPEQFVENLQNAAFIHPPPDPQNILPVNIAQGYLSDYYNEEIKVLSAVCGFEAQELSVQPYIRKIFKTKFYQNGYVTTEPTEQGKKDLDVFNPSYRVKRITKKPIESFENDDLFLDIVQNEKNQLITVKIFLEDDQQKALYTFLESLYITPTADSQWDIMRKEVLRKLQETILLPEIQKEIKTELREQAENYVISKCKDKFKSLLMTGPFSTQTSDNNGQNPADERPSGRQRQSENEVIKDRIRLNVMGVILQQDNSNNQIVTVAVVDKYGELVAHGDFAHLIPPRKPKQGQRRDDEFEERSKMMKISQSEEEKEHEKDKDKIQDLMIKHMVDLVVVGANRLEARKVKETLKEIADRIKSYGGSNYDNRDDDDNRRSKRRQYDAPEDERKEAFVIWGSLDIPKLFASSHQSKKLLKDCTPIMKQAVSLARYEQDPMQEILNLWSSIPSENQTLSCNLHPLQKMINQAKLADSLEEISFQCVNDVGVDLNILIDHDHMHSTLQFISGLGPRKARRLIQMIKANKNKIQSRGELYNNRYLEKVCFISALAFIKIRCPPEDIGGEAFYDILDQTRIHQESYVLALKVAKDVLYDTQDTEDKNQYYKAVKEVIMNPRKLNSLDIKKYNLELETTGQANMTPIIDLIIEEFAHPFKDPREYRTPTRLQITNEQLFYMLINESERTFKRGIIVTATVTRVLDNKAFCKLDNGCDAIIFKEDLLGKTEEKLTSALSQGHVISGRISKIDFQQENRFQVILNCKRKDLENHIEYIDQSMKHLIPKEDLINQNFQTEQKEQKQYRYQSRRINHPKFKNISSTTALQELRSKEVGDFVFRPSSKGADNITLTWKFYTNNTVHMDIEESDKPVGASIGNKLRIGDELFENLQEIVERYIMPCNRLLREVITHQKFITCDNQEELEQILKQEKQEDASRIPYKFTIMDKYPQHVVLGYIPKKDLVKEYIKIKPRGYYFHDKYHSPFQNLINWFKENFRTREYLKIMKRQRSPKARQVVAEQNYGDAYGARSSSQPEWENVNASWKKSAANSVHSMNEDQHYGDAQQTPIMKTEYTGMKTSEHGAASAWGTGQSNIGAFSDYNQINTNQMSSREEDRGRSNRGRPDQQCFNCKELGHMSRDCPNKDRRYERGGSRPRDRDEGRDNRSRPEASGWEQQNQGAQPSKSPSNANWGETFKAENVQKSPGAGGWGRTEQQVENQPSATTGWGAEQQQTAGGWGSKTPQRTDAQPTWGDNAGANESWGNAVMNDDDRGRGSPARSQRSYDDNRGRGRGRGRGGAPGGGRECFKCHQEGHMARDCPNAPEGGDRPRGGGNRECFKCHQEGHMARDCPNEDTNSQRGDRGRGRGRGRGGDREGGNVCFKCNEPGHFARECPNQSSNNNRDRGERRDRGDRGSRDDREGQPYKRQRREDGGSVRRDNDDYDQNNQGGSSGWAQDKGDGASGWNKDQEGNTWGASAEGGWNQAKPTESSEGAWGAKDVKPQGDINQGQNKPEGSGW